jgi:hypothetical protein
MSGGDGTGLTGRGSGTVRGMGSFSAQRRMSENRAGAGIGGECVCPVCGATIAHQQRIPCNTIVFLKCHARMTRK